MLSYTASLWQQVVCCAFGSVLKCMFVGHLVSLHASHRGEWGCHKLQEGAEGIEGLGGEEGQERSLPRCCSCPLS